MLYVSGSTAVAEGQQGDLVLFPVPSDGWVALRSGDAPITALELLDAHGRVVLEERSAVIVGLDLSALAAGTCTARLTLADGRRLIRTVARQ